jgi:hypothetical protein
MRCISSITAAIAACAARASSHQSSTRIAVPMMASSRLCRPSFAAPHAAPRRGLRRV